jgi:hypothetical protein
VNIDPLKSSLTESAGNVGKRSRIGETTVSSSGASDDSELDTISQQGLLDLVKTMPDVRPEVVEKVGERLAEDPSYPTDEMVDKFAKMLAGADTGIMDSIEAETEGGDENV